MEKDLCKFYDYVRVINKDLSEYNDEKGNCFIFNTVNALVRMDYLELTKEEFTSLKFQQKVEDLDYEIINIKRPVPKNEITGKDEDKFTITEKEVAVRKVWNVSNAFGITKSFINQLDALNFYNEINSKYLPYITK